MGGSHGFMTWRSSEDAEHVRYVAGRLGRARYCPYCGELLVETATETADWQGNLGGLDCYFCGWFQWHMDESWCSLYDEEQYRQAILVDFDINDRSLVESEIRLGIAADSGCALSLSPRRLEELVAAYTLLWDTRRS